MDGPVLFGNIRIQLSMLIGVVTASPEVGTSRAKLDVAFFGWVWIIVESGNILHMRNLLRANSSATEVKNERVEVFACESFYLLLLFFLSALLFVSAALELLFLSSSPHWALQLCRVTSR